MEGSPGVVLARTVHLRFSASRGLAAREDGDGPSGGTGEDGAVAGFGVAPAGERLAVQAREFFEADLAIADALPQPSAVALDDLFAGAVPADDERVVMETSP